MTWLRQGMWWLLPVLVSGIVLVDPWLVRGLPADIVRGLHLRDVPYGVPVVLGVLGLCAMGCVRVVRTDFPLLAMGLLLVASQLNGIKAGPADIFDVALFGVLAFWIARYALDVTRPLRVSALFFMAGGLVILAIAHLPMMSPVPWFIGVFGITRVAIIVLLVVDLCRDLRMLDTAFRIMVVTAVISAILGIVQFTLAYTQIFYFTLIDPPLSAFKPTPIGFVMRASGLCTTAQHFSSFLVYALPIAMWRVTETRRIVDAAVVVIILAGVGVSLNFGAMFAAMLVMGVLPFLRWPHLAIHLGLGLMGVISLAYFAGALDVVYDLSFGDAGIAKGVDQRRTLFALGLEQFGRNPLIGTGMRGFGDVDGNFWDRPVHNLFGQAGVELGVLGLLIVVGVFYMLTLDLARLGGRPARIALLMVVAAVMLGQSEPNLDQSNLWVVLALAQAVVLIGRGQRMSVTSANNPRPTRAVSDQNAKAQPD